jgi:hypothetical protein
MTAERSFRHQNTRQRRKRVVADEAATNMADEGAGAGWYLFSQAFYFLRLADPFHRPRRRAGRRCPATRGARRPHGLAAPAPRLPGTWEDEAPASTRQGQGRAAGRHRAGAGGRVDGRAGGREGGREGGRAGGRGRRRGDEGVTGERGQGQGGAKAARHGEGTHASHFSRRRSLAALLP